MSSKGLSYASRWNRYLDDDPLVLDEKDSIAALTHRDDESSIEARSL